jgi:hypothetical protein
MPISDGYEACKNILQKYDDSIFKISQNSNIGDAAKNRMRSHPKKNHKSSITLLIDDGFGKYTAQKEFKKEMIPSKMKAIE